MTVHPAGACSRCGAHTSTALVGDRRQCNECGRVWSPDSLPTGGKERAESIPEPTEVDVTPRQCQRMRQLRRRGADVEHLAGLFDVPEYAIRWHVAARCSCSHGVLPVESSRGGGRR